MKIQHFFISSMLHFAAPTVLLVIVIMENKGMISSSPAAMPNDKNKPKCWYSKSFA